jgi:hypothetical protein
MKVKPPRLVEPLVVFTETVPDVALAPTIAVIKESDTTVNDDAGIPPNDTPTVPLKPFPVITTTVPVDAAVGVNEVMRSTETPPPLGGRVVSLAIGVVIVRGVLKSVEFVQEAIKSSVAMHSVAMHRDTSLDAVFIQFLSGMTIKRIEKIVKNIYNRSETP